MHIESPHMNRALAVIEAFALRARRVLAHSLCESDANLDALADGGMVLIRDGASSAIRWELPQEQDVESLAVRVRPLTLASETIHYDKVLNALSACLSQRDRADLVSWCRDLKRDWRSVDIKTGKSGYQIIIHGDGESGELRATSSELAEAWFYGDAVHAEERDNTALKRLGLSRRFLAAAVRVAQLAVMTRDTYSFLKFVISEGLVPLHLEDLEATPVSVEQLADSHHIAFHTAEPGTALPDSLSADLDPHVWSDVSERAHVNGRYAIRIPWGHDPVH